MIELSYFRSDLLKMSFTQSSRQQPPDLLKILSPIPNIYRKETSEFNGLEHLDKGMSIFCVDYVRSYSPEFDE